MNSRYNTYSDYMKSIFGKKVVKLGIDGGFTCPNRDGTLSRGGCIFCGSGASEFSGIKTQSITEQLERQKDLYKGKWGDSCYCAYFQSFTNTYGPLEDLKSKYEEALSFNGVVAMAIATRPDCLSKEVLDLLAEINEKTFLWIELGLQTIDDNVAKYINRGYGLSVYDEAVSNLKSRNLKYVTHLIFGLPNETEEMILNSVNHVVKDKPFGVKFHSMFVERETVLENLYERGQYMPITLEAYTNLICKAISLTPKETVIHRITGDGDKNKLIAPLWSADKLKVISNINKRMKELDIKQGCCYKES